MTAVMVTVYGVPATQGSSRAFVRGKRAIITSANNDRLKPWREAVRSTLVDHIGPSWLPIDGPTQVTVKFLLPRPASAPKRRRTWPVGARSGDLDKLARAVLDAATDAGVWRDDAQVVRLSAGKDYAADYRPRAIIHICPYEEP